MATRPAAKPGAQARPQPGIAEQQPAAGGAVQIARWRVYTLLLVAVLLLVWIAGRLYQVQVIQSDYLADLARREIQQQITIHPSRGQITDRLGNVLAMDVERESLWVIPSLIPPEQVPQLAITLSALLGLDADNIETALTSYDYYWLPIARWLEPARAEQVAALNQPGLRLVYEPLRYYPQGDFAAHVIGAVNRNGDGISGVESFYNTTLQGITGTIKAEFDGASNPIAIAPQQNRPARNGANLRLTIDPMVQYIAETELQRSVAATNADGGSVVILEVSTGAIRGMASLPTFDPNRYMDFAPELYSRNPAINSVYEPGSSFKMVTIAAGLQSRAFTADTLVNDVGTVYRYDTALSNWNHVGNGMLDPNGVIYYSSNVGAILFNELTGPENFYRMVRAFGFGAPTGVDMGGEESGIVHDVHSPTYNDIFLATNAYGQGISVTPLQMTLAAAVIANDGLMMRPYVVEERCDADTCTTTEPTPMGQVVDPGVAWTVRRMMVNSANHYAPVVWASQTGSYADQWLIPGYQVGAKTSTASIPLPGGGYDPNYTIGAVLGFAPAEDARYAVLVKVDRPKNDIWGVQTAIPLFYNVVERLLRHERIPPDPSLYSPGQ